MIYIGDKELKSAYVGDTPVKIIYRGSQIIWQKTLEPSASFLIISPTEGQEISGDLNIQLEVDSSTLRIISPTEGQKVLGDLNIQLELQ
jgi:hypothetical protein